MSKSKDKDFIDPDPWVEAKYRRGGEEEERAVQKAEELLDEVIEEERALASFDPII